MTNNKKYVIIKVQKNRKELKTMKLKSKTVTRAKALQKAIERRNTLLAKIITKYGFENDITLEFARIINKVSCTSTGEAIVDAVFAEFMRTPE